MKIVPLLLSTALAWAAPAYTQSMNMPSMAMPAPTMHATKRKAAKKVAIAPKAKAATAQAKRKAETPANPEAMPGRSIPAQSAPTQQPMKMPMPAQPSSGASMPMQMSMPMSGHGADQMPSTGALGAYPMQRESSGTAWQPDSSADQDLMTMSGDWMLMAHGVVNFVYDRQSGQRGGDKAFASGMLMGMTRRPLGDGTLQFKAMVSPDPLMGPDGYPLLLASGETANGRDRLIDRQHPHDFFMELSASASQNIGPKSSAFIYAALPGEPAFGPPAFMHRESIMDSPEAPIAHHWLDSTHVSFGVVTAGVVLDRVKLEISRFNGREPDQHRWDIETGPLDSSSVCISWNPTRTLALQSSWGYLRDPEQLEPGANQKRLSASVMWADEIAPGWKAATTLAWGRRTALGHSDNAFAAEASLKRAHWTLFGRAEMADSRELIQGQDNPAYRVGKVSLGAIRDVQLADHLAVGAGGLFSVNFVPEVLRPLYGGSNLTGVMGFFRIKLNLADVRN